MLAFDGMIVGAAEQAGIKVPQDLENYDPNAFPYWQVFKIIQIGAAMPYPTAHFNNAEVISKVPEDQIRTVTTDDLIALGLSIGFPSP